MRLTIRKHRAVGGSVDEGRVSPNNERWHQTLKNCILLENYFLPGDLEDEVAAFVGHYNHHRNHEALGNVTPADIYFGQAQAIIKRKEMIKQKTIEHRRLQE